VGVIWRGTVWPAVLIALVIAAPASAAWLAPIGLPAPVGDAAAVGIAAAPDGTIAVLSARNVSGTPSQYGLDAYVRPPGGAFGALQVIEPLSSTFSQASGLAAASDGSIEAAWRAGSTLKFARLAPGATTFTTLPSYTFPAGEFPQSLSVPVRQPDGTLVAVVVTDVFASNAQYVKALSLAPGAGSWTFGPTLDTISYSSSPIVQISQLGIDAAGHVAVAWTVYNPSTPPRTLKAARTTTGATFGSPELLDSEPSDTLFFPSLATSSGGETTVMWFRGAGASSSIRTKRAQSGSAFPGIADPGDFVSIPPSSNFGTTRLAYAGDDLLATLMFAPSGGSSVNQVALNMRPAGQSFGEFTGVSEGGVPTSTANVAGQAGGTGVATWLRGSGSGYTPRIQAVVRRPGGAWGQRESVTGPIDTGSSFLFSGPLPAIDQAGNPLVAFAQGDGADPERGQSAVAVDDLTPPTITGFDVPASVVAGAPLHVTAAASDDWSGVTFAWDFGDGGNAGGAAADHTFATAGTRTVTVTATDGGGNTATRSAQVAVSNPALVISNLKISPKRFKARRGTTISFAVNLRADLTLTFARARRGHRKGAKCVAKRCTRYIKVGTLKRPGRGPGTVKVKFKGRLGKRLLKPGAYRLTVSALGAKPATATFTVLK